MKKEITGYLFKKIEWLLSHIGVPKEISERFDTAIMLIITVAITFLIAEVIYRIMHFAAKRIVKRKRYIFLEKTCAILYIINRGVFMCLSDFSNEEV